MEHMFGLKACFLHFARHIHTPTSHHKGVTKEKGHTKEISVKEHRSGCGHPEEHNAYQLLEKALDSVVRWWSHTQTQNGDFCGKTILNLSQPFVLLELLIFRVECGCSFQPSQLMVSTWLSLGEPEQKFFRKCSRCRKEPLLPVNADQHPTLKAVRHTCKTTTAAS